MYRGKEGEQISLNGLSYDVDLVSGLENQGYLLYTDNFYSSPNLFRASVAQGFGAVGTLDPKRRGSPTGMVSLKRRMMKTCYERGY